MHGSDAPCWLWSASSDSVRIDLSLKIPEAVSAKCEKCEAVTTPLVKRKFGRFRTASPRRSPPSWAEAPCRGSSTLICSTPPSATRGWWPSRRPCGGGPRSRHLISGETRSATRASPPSWRRRRRRRQVRYRRRLECWRSSGRSTSATHRPMTPAAPPLSPRLTAARCRRS